MSDLLANDTPKPIEVNPYGGEIKYTTKPNGKWEKRYYDRLGREAYLLNSNNYWSRHEYEDVGQQGTIVTYYNSKGIWYKHLINHKGQVVWYENDGGVWYVIVDTSQRVYFNRISKQYMVGSQVFTYSEAVVYLKQRKVKTCPTVLLAVRWNNLVDGLKAGWIHLFKEDKTWWR